MWKSKRSERTKNYGKAYFRNRHFVRKYGVTAAERDALAVQQGGLCAICRGDNGQPLHLDHDHVTGRVRGLLCSGCNQGLGLFGENAERMASAIEYLRR